MLGSLIPDDTWTRNRAPPTLCRFIFYRGESISLSSLITEPKNSLIHQSFDSHERREPLNGDGFGVAWYPREGEVAPGLFRSMTPAWNNVNLASLASVVSSHCILAHVRAATQPDSVSEANCHPFVFGQLAFMHNGELGGFQELRRDLLGTLSDASFQSIRGRTDSEHLFAVFLDQLGASAWPASADELGRALVRTFREALGLARLHKQEGQESYLNVAITNGSSAVVSRFTTKADYDGESLYWIHGSRCVCECGTCRMERAGNGAGAVVVSSERLDQDSGWSPVPRNHMVLLAADGTTAVRSIDL